MKTISKKLFTALILLLVAVAGKSQCDLNWISITAYSSNATAYITNYHASDSIAGQDSVHYTWDFGDGHTELNNNWNIQHNYATNGTYTICVNRHYYPSGCDTTACITVDINICGGLASFNQNVVGFGKVKFDAVSLASVPGSTILWNFGDGGTATTASPVHQYTANGSYDVCAYVTNASAGCADTSCTGVVVDVCNYPFHIDTAVLAYNPIQVQFTANPLDADASINWNFSDGGTATGGTVTHTFYSSADYTVASFAQNTSAGCWDSSSLDMHIDICGLHPIYYINPYDTTASFQVFFWDSTSGTPSSFWSLPGATPDSGSGGYVFATYPAYGTYPVCVYNSVNGCTDTICTTVTLGPPPPPTYYLTGTVNAGTTTTGQAVVYLIRQDTVGHLTLIDSQTVYLDTIGSYFFNGLPVDTYYLKAALLPASNNYLNYLPTYFGDVLNWANATPVVTSSNQTLPDINLIEGSNPGGPGFVSGFISQGAGVIIHGHGNNDRSVGDPLGGVQVNLVTSADVPVAYTYTDNNGVYHFSNLALGTYKIYVEQLNKVPVPAEVTLTAENPGDTVDISINSTGATPTGIEDVNKIELSRMYPNPTTTTLNLEVTATQNNKTTLKLSNVLGQAVIEQPVQLSNGLNTLRLDVQQIPAGVYELSLQTSTRQLNYKVVIENRK